MLQTLDTGELLRRFTTFLRQLTGNHDLNAHKLIASHLALFDSLAPYAKDGPVLGAGRHLQHHLSVIDRPHLYFRSKHRLSQIQGHFNDQVQSVPRKESVRLDLESNDEVAGRTSLRTAFALA